MEACVRGFSYMPDKKLDLELQYVESSELEGSWKATRRERAKQQEQKIWDDFLKENDIINQVCEDDPYQFLTQIPEPQLHQLMEMEFQRMAEESYEEETHEENVPKQEIIKECQRYEMQHVTLVPPDHDDDTTSPGDDDVFHIFDDGDDDDDAVVKEDQMQESEDEAQLTVRARDGDDKDSNDKQPGASKSFESMKCAIESSIYCARVRDLRGKINEQLQAMITSLDTLDLGRVDPEEVKKMKRRSAEFSARFNRIYMYQLQRQTASLSRAGLGAGAQHTALQRRLAHAAAAHDAALHALTVFHKSFDQTGCVCDAAGVLRSLLAATRDITIASADLPRTKQLTSGADLYSDNMLNYCDKLEAVLSEHVARTADLLSDDISQKTRKGKGKKHNTSAKGFKSGSEARLSMYSLDARFNLHPKKSKVCQPSMTRLHSISNQSKNQKANSTDTSKGKMKSPLSRRVPLLGPRGAALGDLDICTMVESVGDCTCESSRISRDQSPVTAPTKSARTSSRRATKRNDSDNNYANKTQQVVDKKEEQLSAGCEMEAMLMSALQAEAATLAPSQCTDTIPCCDDEMVSESSRDKCEVTKLLQKLCGEKITRGKRGERVSGAKNAQLHCVTGASPRPPTTPQLLRILEETIQKKSPRSYMEKPSSEVSIERFRLPLHLSDEAVTAVFKYRTAFVQHMLSSSMYANSTVQKPWEMVGNVSEKIIDDLLGECAKYLKLRDLKQLRHNKT